MKRILLGLLLCAVSIPSFSQTAKEENELLRQKLQEESERGKKLFMNWGNQNIPTKKLTSSVPLKVELPKEEHDQDQTEINKLTQSLEDVSQKIENLEKEREIARLKDQESHPLMLRVVNLIDNRQEKLLAAMCDSILDLGTLSEEVVAVSALIKEYAEAYKYVPYEKLSPERVVIRQFVTFFDDPSSKPSGSFYCNVWDTNFVYCYPGKRFDIEKPLEFVFVDFTHRYHPPCDPYLGDPEFPQKKAVSRGYADEGKLSDDGTTFVSDGEYIHGATDLRFNPDDPKPKIYATFDGVVRLSMNNGRFGNVIVIRHYNGLESTVAHNDQNLVKAGDHVKAGDIIAYGGNTGHGTGRHCHFELSFRGRRVDPESIINFADNPLYDNHGVEPYHLFARVIEVSESGDSDKDKYKTHSVKVIDHLTPALSRSFISGPLSPTGGKEITISKP